MTGQSEKPMRALIARDVAVAVQSGGTTLTTLLFLLAVVTIIPFGVGPDLNILSRIGPAMIWTTALLATLIGLERLFQADQEDGSLDLLLLADIPISFVVIAKVTAHWLVSGLPIVIAAPILSLLLAIEPPAILALTATLLVGTPALSCLGAVGAALAVTLRRGALLMAVIILPFSIPVLIFAVASARAAIVEPDPFWQPFLLLCATSLFYLVVGVAGAAAGLRLGRD